MSTRAFWVIALGLISTTLGVIPLLAQDESAPPAADLRDAELVEQVEAIIEHRVETGEFSGTVLLARNDQLLMQAAWGFSNLTDETPNQLGTRFNIGSITKLFMSVLIGQLVESGELSYDTLVGEVLPDYRNRRVRETVRVRHLLTHTSGIPDWWKLWERARRPQMNGLADYRKLFERRSLQFEPGSQPSYSNSGVIVLGLMVEKITGQDYYSAAKERVFDRAGMTGTAWLPIHEPVADQAVGYELLRGKRVSGAKQNPTRGEASGNSFSNVADMHHFALALRDGTLWSNETLALHSNAKLNVKPNLPYGYLFFDFGEGITRHIGHDGGSAGVNAEFFMFTETDYVLVVLSNFGNGANIVSREVRELLKR